MTFTAHGHHIPGSISVGIKPTRVRRCGGPTECDKCSSEVSSYIKAKQSQIQQGNTVNQNRVERLKGGNWQFGHSGMHEGVGTEDCPRERHHHCDDFCYHPTISELVEAGIDPAEFKAGGRE